MHSARVWWPRPARLACASPVSCRSIVPLVQAAGLGSACCSAACLSASLPRMQVKTELALRTFRPPTALPPAEAHAQVDRLFAGAASEEEVSRWVLHRAGRALSGIKAVRCWSLQAAGHGRKQRRPCCRVQPASPQALLCLKPTAAAAAPVMQARSAACSAWQPPSSQCIGGQWACWACAVPVYGCYFVGGAWSEH